MGDIEEIPAERIAIRFDGAKCIHSRNSRAGVLKLVPQPDGPLRLEGNLEICTGTGHTINRVGKTALCRCGQSSKKPYCDGTHAKIGFKTA